MYISLSRCRFGFQAVVLLVIGLANAAVALAAETSQPSWPCWMGPRHDGISLEQGLATEWPDSGLPVQWKKQLGIGYSSISIADGRLFSMGHTEGEETVFCLNPESGEEIWSYAYPCALVDNLHDGGPGSTPTIEGEYVYTLGREGQLFCFRAATGEIVWQKLLQEDLGVEMPEWGFTSSPYILGDQLILEAGRVVSYNKTTGKKNWQTEKHAIGYGSAISFTHNKKLLLATLDNDGIRVTNASDGRSVAFVEWDSPYLTNSTTPIFRGDKIFVSTGYNIGCVLLQLDDEELEPIYTNREMCNHMNNCILYQGHLYGFDGNSHRSRTVEIKCMDFENGEVLWGERGLGCGSLMIVDGKLLILSEEGELLLAEATPDEFRVLARSPFLDGRCWTVPVILDSRIYGRNAAGSLVCAQLPQKK